MSLADLCSTGISRVVSVFRQFFPPRKSGHAPGEPAGNDNPSIAVDGARDTLIYSFMQILAVFIVRLLLSLKCHGIRNVPRRGGVLLVCTHQSHLDPMIYGANLPRQVSYFAKAELFENRHFSAFIRALHAFPVRRGEADVGAMKEAIRRLKAGCALVVFPEGTRSIDGSIKPLEAGVGLIARRAGVPVIPAIVDGSYKVLPKGARFPRPQKVAVMYGKPLDVDGLKPAEIVALIERTLRMMQVELRNQVACTAKASGRMWPSRGPSSCSSSCGVGAVGQRADDIHHREVPLLLVPGTTNLPGSENDDLPLRIGR